MACSKEQCDTILIILQNNPTMVNQTGIGGINNRSNIPYTLILMNVVFNISRSLIGYKSAKACIGL